ncbi:MAG TPA: serine hydrolase domain-containing protein [Polyangiaceae bacterium]
MVLFRSSARRVSPILPLMVGALALPACGAEEPGASPDEIARAKSIYTQCVEDEIGMEVVSLEILPSGDITVEFGEGYSEENARRAIDICEARIASVLEPDGGLSVLGPPPNLGRPGTDAELERLLRDRVRLGFEGALVAEYQGTPRLSAGFGAIAPGSKRAPDPHTAFDCGSIMKPVTAAAVFLLEQDGLLSRDQTLGELFDTVPNEWSAVTIQQVLTHTAGFHDFHDTEGDFEPMDRSTALQRIFEQQPLSRPGEEWAYSNSGYTLLAILIEDLTGEDYRDIVRTRVFEPLGMQRSGFYSDGLWEDGNVAVGQGDHLHEGNDPARWPEPTWALRGNGGLVSTASDLLALVKGFQGDVLFEPETRQAFHRDYFARTPGALGDYAVLGAAGANDYGFRAVVLDIPADSSYVVAASRVLSAAHAEIVGIEVLQVLYGEELELPEPE